MQTNKQIYPEQIIRYVSGQYSAADEEFVQQWLREDPARKKTLLELQDVWELSGKLKLGDVDQAWSDLSPRTTKAKGSSFNKIGRLPNTTRKPSMVFLRVAAMLLVMAGAYAFYQYSLSVESSSAEKEPVTYKTISSKQGEQAHFRFNDNTKVVLNASSHIRYRSDFGTAGRELHLEGEAYFEVNHDHRIPFVVYANGARIEDIGTKFNIKAYPKLKDTDVVVSEGKVRVSARGKADSKKTNSTQSSVIVSQGQKVSVRDKDNQLYVQKADLYKALSWLQKRLIFDGEALARVEERLERYYDIDIKVVDPVLYDKKMTASFENEGLENVLKVLAISMDAQYSLEGNKVRFFLKKTAPNINQ